MNALRQLAQGLLGFVLTILMWPTSGWAAQCSDVFPGGATPSSANQLDLSGVNWASAGSLSWTWSWWGYDYTTLAAGDTIIGATTTPVNSWVFVNGSATSRLFVNGNFTIDRDTWMNFDSWNNPGDPADLVIVVNGDLRIRNGALVSGLIYATGNVQIDKDVEVVGAVTSLQAIQVHNQASVTHDPDAVENADLTDLCKNGPDISVDDAQAEQGSPLTFAITLSETWSSAINVDYSTANDTATAGVDYQAASGTVTVPAGQLSATITVNSLSSGNSGSVSFFLNLTGTNKGAFIDQQGIGTITPPPVSCFSDGFARTNLGSDWATTFRSGSFGEPKIVNNRLRLTNATANVATAATLQRLFPGADNLIQVEFEHFAYGGSSGGTGADGIAVTFSDASITPQPGSFGGSLGYAQRNNGDPGFNGGWVGIGIDEYGNFSGATEGRQGGPGRRLDSVTVRGSGSGSTGYRFIATTGSLVPGIDIGGNAPGPAHKYRITLDSRTPGQSLLTVERDTGSAAGYVVILGPVNMLTQTGQSAVPENFLFSLTGSTGGSVNIHELGSFQACATTMNPMGTQIDHFEFVHDASALTCEPEEITVRACLDASCAQLFTDPVSVTLSPTGWFGGDSKSMSGGEAVFKLQQTVAGAVNLGILGSNPPTKALSQTLCRVGGSVSAANCSLTFVDAGFSFDVPNGISHKPSGPVRVRAVEKALGVQQCVPAFANVTREVSFYSTYVNPDSTGRVASRSINLTTGAVSADIGQAAADATSFQLDFDSNGEAAINVTYPDAGQMRLNAIYTGSAANGDAGLLMTGADLFVSRPAGLCVRSTASCAAGDVTCPKFWVAGDPFSLLITAAGWQSDSDTDLCVGNGDTPSYAQSDIVLDTELIAPIGGTDGTLSLATYNHVAVSDATMTLQPWQSEVGVFQIIATPPTTGYLGGTAVPAGTSPNLGRFVPDHLEISLTSTGSFQPFCNSFSYIGQPFGFTTTPSLEVVPYNAQGGITTNYSGVFRRLTDAQVQRATPLLSENLGKDGSKLAVAVDHKVGELTDLTGLNRGRTQYDFNATDTFVYPKADGSGNKIVAAEVAPFPTNILLAISSATDSDNVPATVLPTPWNPIGIEMRHGRLLMQNAFGPETMPLAVSMQAEFYNGTQYVINTEDSCTTYNAVDLSVTNGFSTSPSGSGSLVSGRTAAGSEIKLSAPGLDNEGTADLSYAAPVWLLEDWDSNGSLDSPSSKATFGQYRGNDRVIYWREIIQ